MGCWSWCIQAKSKDGVLASSRETSLWLAGVQGGTDLGHSDTSSSEYHRIVQIVYDNFCELGVGMWLGSRGTGGMEGESNETEIDVLGISVRLIS